MLTRTLPLWLIFTLVATDGVAEEPKRSALARLNLTGVDPAVKTAVVAAADQVRKSPSSDKTWGALGMVLYAHDFLEEARVAFIRAAELNPREPRWPYLHSNTLLAHDPEAAIPLMLTSADLCDDKPDAPRLRAAELLLSLDRLDEAQTHFERILKQTPNHCRALLGLARIAVRRTKYDLALDHLEHTAAHPSAKKASHQLLAQIHLLRGDRAAADFAQKEAASIVADRAWPDPMSEEIGDLKTGKKTLLARLDRLLAHDDIDAAKTLGQEAVEKYPDSEWAWTLLARALIKKRDYAAAEKALLKALELAPEAIESQFRLGVVYMHQKRNKEALALFRRAVALKNDFAMAHYNIGQCLLLEKDKPGAIAALKSAVRYQPNMVAGQWQLAELLVQEGRLEESLEHYRTALRLNPDARIRRRLEEIERKTGAAKPTR